jgi:hypothetical protein
VFTMSMKMPPCPPLPHAKKIKSLRGMPAKGRKGESARLSLGFQNCVEDRRA